MAYVAGKSRTLIAFIAMMIAVLILVPAADAMTCAADEISASQLYDETAPHDHVSAHNSGDDQSDMDHGACSHGHVHANPGWHGCNDVSWASCAPCTNQPLFAGNDRRPLFAPDGLERPPRA